MKLYIITVCDDNPEEASRLCALTQEYFTEHRLEFKILEYLDSCKLAEALRQGKRSDVYILDIVMPEINGIELAELIRQTDKSGSIIFATLTDNYAINGYKVGALDYIVKPVPRDELFAAFDKIIEHISRIGTIVIRIKNKKEFKEILTEKIVSVESRRRNVMFFLSDGSVETVSGSIESYAPFLERYRFFLRCHKSCIVNLNFVKELKDGIFNLENNERVPISRSHLIKCRDYYHDYIFSKMKGV